MKPKQIARIATDILMTFVLLLLMAHSLVGEAAHEWLGVGMFALFVLHHALNSHWHRNLRKGRYVTFRVLQSALVALIMLCMIGSMVSGIALSRHVFAFLGITGGAVLSKQVHMLCAYWGFVLMSLHLGIHWSIMMGMARTAFRKPSGVRKWLARAAGLAIACYGAYAFVQRQIGAYMLLRIQFAFFDFSEPIYRFLLDYVAAMGLFVWLGHDLAEGIRQYGRKRGTA